MRSIWFFFKVLFVLNGETIIGWYFNQDGRSSIPVPGSYVSFGSWIHTEVNSLIMHLVISFVNFISKLNILYAFKGVEI